MGKWNLSYDKLVTNGTVHKLTGIPGSPAEIEDGRMVFRADVIEYNADSGDVHAEGHVYFKDFDKNEELWASSVDYNTDEEEGKFYDVRGVTHPRIVARPGILSVDSPFYFEGKWAERIGTRYILYNGWITNCKLPKPWWQLRGPRFEIEPQKKAVAHRSVFYLRRMPLFYAPYFYHSLQKEPRKSGFLLPNFVPRSKRGVMVGLGYYWAISRSYDATYRFEDFTTNAYTHHVDFRGKPRVGTEISAILYSVQDHGMPGSGPNPPTFSGTSLYVVGKSDLGNGWIARGNLNYLSSFRFRQQWSESYNEFIFTEIHSIGYVEKDWKAYTFDVGADRLENYESVEQPITNPVTGKTNLVTNAVVIRKLPEATFTSRDQQIGHKIPLWFSFDSTAGLLSRSEPFFQTDATTGAQVLTSRFETSPFTDRVHLAPRLTSAFHLGSFSLIPSFGLDETYYGESQTTNPADPPHLQAIGTNLVRSARDFSLDMIFPSLARVYNKKTVFGDKLKHVIEPRVTYRYVTGIGSDFDRFVRFDENELLANTNELTLSLTNRIYAKRGDSVQEIFTWELTQKRYFDPTFGGALIPGQRNVFTASADLTAYAFLVEPRSTSPIASLLRMSPINGLGIQWLFDYDHRTGRLMDSTVSADYRWRRYVLGVGNNAVVADPTQSTPAQNQFSMRVGYGDFNRRGWNIGAEARYDYRTAIILYSTSQLTYNTDCCGISLQYHRFNSGIRDESQIRISFSIANIGSLGTLRKQDRIF